MGGYIPNFSLLDRLEVRFLCGKVFAKFIGHPVISGLRRLIEVIEGRLEVWKADFRPEEQILGLRGRIEALRADLKPGELI